MKIGLVQYNPEWENKESNKNKINNLLSNSNDNYDLLILPELTLTGFTMFSEKYGENLSGDTVSYFQNLSNEYKTNILFGLIEDENGIHYNSLLHIDKEGNKISNYRKIHPFSYSTEDQHYKRGLNTVVTKIDDWKIGLSICYDLRFPELYRNYGKAGTELIVCIANWPDTRIEHWDALLKARAIENQCFVAGVNRVGNDPRLKYNGHSSVYSPMGENLISSVDNENIVSVEIDLEKVKDVRSKLPFLDDIFLI